MNNTQAPSYHVAIVAAVDLANASVRVTVAELDGLLSWWLQVLMPFTGINNAYAMPHVGDRVAVLLDSDGSRGCVLGAVYSQQQQPSDTGANLLSFQIPQTRIAGDVEILGDVVIKGNIDATGDVSMNGTVAVEGAHSINAKDTVVVGSKDTGGDTNAESGQ